MPKIDLDAIESHLRAAREEERRVSVEISLQFLLHLFRVVDDEGFLCRIKSCCGAMKSFNAHDSLRFFMAKRMVYESVGFDEYLMVKSLKNEKGLRKDETKKFTRKFFFFFNILWLVAPWRNPRLFREKSSSIFHLFRFSTRRLSRSKEADFFSPSLHFPTSFSESFLSLLLACSH